MKFDEQSAGDTVRSTANEDSFISHDAKAMITLEPFAHGTAVLSVFERFERQEELLLNHVDLQELYEWLGVQLGLN